MRVRHGGHDAVGPVEALRGHIAGGVRQIDGGGVYVSIEGHRLVEGVGAHSDPFHALQIVGHIGPQLGDGHEIVAVDADGAVHSPA